MDMNIKDVSANEGIKIVSALDDIKDMRQVADQLDLRYSGNSGIKAIRTKIIAYLTEQETDEDEPMTDLPKIPEPETPPTELPNAVVGVPPEEPIQVAKIPKKKAKLDNNDLLSMDPKQVKDPVLRRLVVRAKALRLIRVQITNLDPADSALSGAIISVINKYTGKVSKYIPFGDGSENGYHVPKMLLDHIKNQKFALRKEIKGGKFGVKRYKTTMVNKFVVTELDDLTKGELKTMAARQSASQAIDND